jgi:acylphosphatase
MTRLLARHQQHDQLEEVFRPEPPPAAAPGLVSFAFTVHGKVQRVFFRKYTEAKAQELGLVGWCKNTPEGTVEGVAQGSFPQMAQFKEWLQHKGSPKRYSVLLGMSECSH